MIECAGHSLLLTAARAPGRCPPGGGQPDAGGCGLSDPLSRRPYLLACRGCSRRWAAKGRTKPLTIYGPAGMEQVAGPLRALAGPLPYPVEFCALLQSVELPELAPGWPAGAVLRPVPHPPPGAEPGISAGAPRAGRFLPEKAQALGVPVRNGSVCKPVKAWRPRRQHRPGAGTGACTPGPAGGVFRGHGAPSGAGTGRPRADLLICDATYAGEEYAAQARQYGHSTFAQTAFLAARAGCRRLWLTHYSPMIEDPGGGTGTGPGGISRSGVRV